MNKFPAHRKSKSPGNLELTKNVTNIWRAIQTEMIMGFGMFTEAEGGR